MKPLVQVKAVNKIYGKGAQTFEALKNITFQVEEGEFVGVMGPSGAGKSTLLNVLATIDAPSSGDILTWEDVKGANAIVFYGATTRSIPAQTTPDKIIVLKEVLTAE